MLWAGSERFHVFLGQTCLGLAAPGGAVQWSAGASPSQLWLAALDAVQGHGRASVHVWLGGALARPFVLPATEGLTKIADVRTIAGIRAAEETGLAGPCSVVVDAWRPGQAAMCVAMEDDLRAAIQGSDGAHGVLIAGIRPWWTAVLSGEAADARSLNVLTVDDGESLVALAGVDQRIDMASTYAPAPDAGQRIALTQRLLAAASAGAGVQRHATLERTAGSQGVGGGARTSRCPFVATWEQAR